jgi:hypothetical protein
VNKKIFINEPKLAVSKITLLLCVSCPVEDNIIIRITYVMVEEMIRNETIEIESAAIDASVLRIMGFKF